VKKENDCKNMVQECIKKYGELDVIVLNAGVNAHIKFEEMKDLSIFQEIMQTNFFGYVFCTKYALPYLKKSKGQIIVLSSLSGEIGLPMRSAYCCSKFAVTGFFESLRIELDNNDVAITIICPPSVKTPMRDHDLAKGESLEKHEGTEVEDKRISVESCVKTILEATDRRARKVFFPFKSYAAVYVRPFFPDLVDRHLKEAAKL